MQFPFETILVSTDLSEHGNAAIPVALALAKGRGARVVLAHVIEGTEIPNPLYAHYHPTPGAKELREMEQRARAELEAAASVAPEVDHEIAIGRGSAAAELCRLAEERHASLIVISSAGHSGVRRFLLGSVAEAVVRRAHCSVLVLRG